MNAQTAPRLFSPTDNLPAALADMDRETLSAHITKAQRVMEFHQDIARNGDPAAEHYYFFIPEVARDMANARYTLSIMFAEIKRRRESQSANGIRIPFPIIAAQQEVSMI